MFSKNFAKSSDKSVYPKWIEVTLSQEEEKQAEKECRDKNYQVMLECIEDAKSLVIDKKLLESQTNIVNIASALFEKRASHEVFFKENLAKQKFDKLQKED